MGGTHEGGKKAAKTLLAKDPDHFRKLAKRARRTTAEENPGNFKNDPDRARKAGQVGGSISRRGSNDRDTDQGTDQAEAANGGPDARELPPVLRGPTT